MDACSDGRCSLLSNRLSGLMCFHNLSREVRLIVSSYSCVRKPNNVWIRIFMKFGMNIISFEITSRFAFKYAVFKNTNMVAVRTSGMGVGLCLSGQISKLEIRVKLRSRLPDNHEILVCDTFSVRICTVRFNQITRLTISTLFVMCLCKENIEA
jgi:hypothetical protein